MRPPKTLKVGPYHYRVKADRHLGTATAHEQSGACGPDTQDLIYDPSNGPMTVRDTLLHEAMHAIAHQVGWQTDFIKIDTKLEEYIIQAMAPRVVELLRDNPEFVVWLTD